MKFEKSFSTKIKKISARRYSSNYGKDNKVFGQPLGVKSLVFIIVEDYSNNKRVHELYCGIYVPDILPNIINFLSKNYIDQEYNFENINSLTSIPFINNSGLIRSITGAIESCIFQLCCQNENIRLIEGIKQKLNKNLIRNSEKLKFYASGGSVAANPGECKEDVKYALRNNLGGFKMRCSLKSIKEDEKRVKAVYEYLKSEDSTIKIMVDFIQGTLKSKLDICKLNEFVKVLNKYKIFWFEEPLDPNKYNLYEKYFKFYGPNENFVLGESFTSLNDYIAYRGLINFFQIDITHLGGFIDGVGVINFMNTGSNETKFSSHVWGSSISILLNLALARACKSIEWFEIPINLLEINNDLSTLQVHKIPFLDDLEIESLISKINYDLGNKYLFIENSGYKV